MWQGFFVSVDISTICNSNIDVEAVSWYRMMEISDVKLYCTKYDLGEMILTF